MAIMMGKHSNIWNHQLISLILVLIFGYKFVSCITKCGPEFNSARVPRDYPKTDIGSFMVYQSFQTIQNKEPFRDVFIYWREIDEINKCGNSFDYFITCTPIAMNTQNLDVHPERSYTNYARFENLSTIIGYKFSVYASNHQGLSSEHSTIEIPSELNRPKKLSLTRKLLLDNTGFQLTWDNLNNKSVDNYTLFWCEKNPVRLYECKGDINWIHVPGSESSHVINIKDYKKPHLFAISENSHSLDIFNLNEIIYKSSGMYWSSCSVTQNNVPGIIENIHVTYVTSTSIDMYWVFECSQTVFSIKGYSVSYCAIHSKRFYECDGPMLSKYIYKKRYGPNQDYITKYDSMTMLSIGDLEPDTTYKLTVLATSNKGEGLPSSPLFVTTQKKGESFKTKNEKLFETYEPLLFNIGFQRNLHN